MSLNTPVLDELRGAKAGMVVQGESMRKRELVSVADWRATCAEFIATLLFVFIGAGSVVATGSLADGELNSGRLVAIALAHGLAIALVVYATANLSGGHINPAVTIAATLTKKISVTKGSMYIVAQLVGAVIGALLLRLTVPDVLEGNLGAHALAPGVTVSMGLLMEIVLTFVLVFVIFATAIDPKGMGRLAPLAIGLAVLVGHIVAVAFTGASMNPARSFGPAAVAGVWSNHWVYWVGPLVGGVAAGLIYQLVFINRTRADQSRPAAVEVHADARPGSERDGLKEIDIFRDLSDEQIDTVTSLGHRSHISAGEVLGTARELGDALFIVIDGKAECSTHSAIGELTVRIAGPGESFPLAALIGSGSLITSIEAMTDMELLTIPRSVLLTLCSEKPEIGMRIYAAIAEVLGDRYRNTLAQVASNAEGALKAADL